MNDINSASIVGRKIESTVNTQLSFSFSTRPLTVNSQQSTRIPVQPELIGPITNAHAPFFIQ
jgi:hypothetical protein